MTHAVVPIGGIAFVAPRICPTDPTDEVVRRTSFAATRARRSMDQWTAPLGTSHHRSASLPQSEALDRSAHSPTRSRHLRLPPEAQARLEAWKAVHESEQKGDHEGQQDGLLHIPLFPPPPSHSVASIESNISESGIREANMGSNKLLHSRSLPSLKHRSGRNRPPRQFDSQGATLQLPTVESPHPNMEYEELVDAQQPSRARTPELDSTCSSASVHNSTLRTPSPVHQRPPRSKAPISPTATVDSRASSEWYIKQDEYAGRMYAHTETMWNRERKRFEKSALMERPAPVETRANGTSRPWPKTQAQLIREQLVESRDQHKPSKNNSLDPSSTQSFSPSTITLTSRPRSSSGSKLRFWRKLFA